MSSNTDRRNRFKAGVDSAESRRRREESGTSVRKNKREEGLAKRRQLADVAEGVVDNTLAVATSGGAATADGDAPVASAPSKTYSAADIPALAAGTRSADPAIVLQSVKGLRRVLSIEPSPPVLEVLAANVMPALVEFLGRHDHPELQFEAAWALTNIASTDQTRKVVEAGAVPHMAQLLLSSSADVREQCAWCLGNVAGDGPDLRNLVLEAGALGPLLQNLLQPASISMLRNAVWSLSNFCRGKPQPELAAVAPAVPVLAQVLASTEDKETLMDACWALSYLSDGENDRVAAVVASGVVPRLVALLGHASPSVVTPALRTLGNVVSGDDGQTQAVVDGGGLLAVGPLLAHAKKGLRKEACWLLSNVAAGSRAQITSLLEQAHLVDAVLHQLEVGEWDVKKEAAWVVSNIATGGTHEQVFALVKNHKPVGPLCSLLDVQDGKLLMVALDALEALLKCDEKASGLLQVPKLVDECDGLEKLEQLQEHENHAVYTKSVHIIETYFGSDESGDEGENLAPASDGTTFGFGLPAAASSSSGGAACGPPAAPLGGFSFAPATAGGVAPLGGGFNFNAQNFNFGGN